MKKGLIIKIVAIVLLIILVVSIILKNSLEHQDVIQFALDNTKIVKVYDYKTKELTDTLEKKDSEELINELNYSKWKKSNSLNGDEKKYLLKLFSEEDAEDILEITIYSSNEYVSVYVPEKLEDTVYKTNHNLKEIFKKNN